MVRRLLKPTPSETQYADEALLCFRRRIPDASAESLERVRLRAVQVCRTSDIVRYFRLVNYNVKDVLDADLING